MSDENTGVTEEQLARYAEKHAAKQAAAGQSSGRDDPQDDQLIDVEQVKKNIEKALRGTTTKWIEPEDGVLRRIEVDPDEDQQLCNDQAILDIKRTIEAHVNVNVSGSYFSPQDIHYTGVKAAREIRTKLYINQEQYDIDGPADASHIMDIVEANLKGALKKALHGRLLKHSEQTREIREVRRSGENEEDKRRSKNPLNWI